MGVLGQQDVLMQRVREAIGTSVQDAGYELAEKYRAEFETMIREIVAKAVLQVSSQYTFYTNETQLVITVKTEKA